MGVSQIGSQMGVPQIGSKMVAQIGYQTYFNLAPISELI